MTVRDAAVTEQVPPLSRFDEYGGYANPRVVYNLGHAAFEFIEARFGKEGIRQFLYTFRKNIVGGGIEDIYMQAFRMKPEEFDEQFEKWLKERFKPFRDKQRPTDYGKDLSPNQEKTTSPRSSPSRPALRRGGGRPHRQPLGGGGRPHPALHQGRQRDQEPHQGLHGQVREHHHQRPRFRVRDTPPSGSGRKLRSTSRAYRCAQTRAHEPSSSPCQHCKQLPSHFSRLDLVSNSCVHML
jgi:hypothetical protein